MNDTTTAVRLDDVDSLLAELDLDYQQLKEFQPNDAMSLTNNSCCGMGSCHTF
jgi:hypothetical protein